MSNIERYHPDGTEVIGLYVPSAIPDLAVAESEIDQPYELEMYAQSLRHEYAEIISAQLRLVADGIMVTCPTDEHSIEEEHGTFEGRILGFGIHELLAQYRVVVTLKNDETNETRTMVISAAEGYESSLFVTNMEQAEEVNAKNLLADNPENMPDPVAFLSGVASELGHLTIDRNILDYLRSTEEFMKDAYHIKEGKKIAVTGCRAYKIEKESILLPYEKSHESDERYVGTFLGIVPHEVRGLHNRHELQLCIALELPEDESVVLQPCHYMKSLELSE